MSVSRDSSLGGDPNHPVGDVIDVNHAAGLGQLLRSARERRGLSLEQVARETKIPRRHLISLERGDLSAIPGNTYRRGEVIAYAKAIDLDRTVALAELERLSPVQVPDDAAKRVPSGWQPRLVRRALLTVAALGTLTLALGIWNQRVGQLGSSLQSAVTNQSVSPSSEITSTPRHLVTPNDASAVGTPATATLQDRVEPAAEAVRQEQASSARVPTNQNDIETSLVIVTDPAGARVTVDGIGWGTTPVTIRNLPAGSKRIRVTKDGYAAAVTAATLREGRSVTLTIPLTTR